MKDIQQNLEARIEVLENKIIQLNEELFKYKSIEHANCGCTNFCYEKENAREAREMYSQLYQKYMEKIDENKTLRNKIQILKGIDDGV